MDLIPGKLYVPSSNYFSLLPKDHESYAENRKIVGEGLFLRDHRNYSFTFSSHDWPTAHTIRNSLVCPDFDLIFLFLKYDHIKLSSYTNPELVCQFLFCNHTLYYKTTVAKKLLANSFE